MVALKYVVFDLDETIGYFTELSIIWGCLQTIYKVSGQKAFDELCYLFEKEYFRPGIFSTMNYLYSKSDTTRVVLYTNNNGSIQWINHIISFLERRSKAPGLFHRIVPGFRPRLSGPHDRRTFEKTYAEIMRCANIPKNTKIIFFDDVSHPKMLHKNVTYIHVKPYSHSMRSSTIIDKLQKSYFNFINYSSALYIRNCIRKYHHQYFEHMKHHGNTRITKTDIYIPLRRFLIGPKKTAKKRVNDKKNRTRKITDSTLAI